jgi:hypothetical protein
MKPLSKGVMFFLVLVSCVSISYGFDSMWSTQVVDVTGTGIHPAISSSVQTVSIRGVVLNSSTEYLPAAAAWGPAIFQVYIQSLEAPLAGIALFEGYFAGNVGADYLAMGIAAGDIVEATGLIANNTGKVNMNSRHGAVDTFTISIVQKAAGMPDPILIPSIAACNFFDISDTVAGEDQYRRKGGELYQAQWCTLKGVHLQSGIWANGETVVIADSSGGTLNMLLSAMGDFTGAAAPSGNFDVVGIFDQEDDNSDGDFQDGYRLWVKKMSAITPESGVDNWNLY